MEKINAPSHKDIIKYWSGKLDELKMGADESEWLTNCWRCGRKTKLQRCHIIPKN